MSKALKEYLVQAGNLKFYSNAPKMSDVEIISLSITAECLGIDSENLLWSKINKDYADLFEQLIHRTRYNHRRKVLFEWIQHCAKGWSKQMKHPKNEFIIDSIPLPVCKICRERRSTVCRKPNDQVKASKGCSSTNKQFYIGYRLDLITSCTGVYQESAIQPANIHDITFLKELSAPHLKYCTLIGDTAYRSAPLQLSLFEEHKIDLSVPYRSNPKGYKEYPYLMKIKRKMIETVFSQYCDDLMLKRNYAKSSMGLYSAC
ncbi:MAG: hypothetical protein ACJA01_004008 [Saprospiraceae bacterium]